MLLTPQRTLKLSSRSLKEGQLQTNYLLQATNNALGWSELASPPTHQNFKWGTMYKIVPSVQVLKQPPLADYGGLWNPLNEIYFQTSDTVLNKYKITSFTSTVYSSTGYPSTPTNNNMKNIPIVCTLASLSSASLLVLQVDARQLVPMIFFSIFFFYSNATLCKPM